MKYELKNLEALILYFAVVLLIRAMWFIIVSSEQFLSATTYRIMDGLIPQWGWAISCLFASIILFFILIDKQHTNIFMVIGGALTAAIYMLLAVATWDASSVSILTFVHITNTIFTASIAWIGGSAWWKERKSVQKLESTSGKKMTRSKKS